MFSFSFIKPKSLTLKGYVYLTPLIVAMMCHKCSHIEESKKLA